MNTHRQLGINSNNGAKSIEKLSSGYRINRAGDDAAGLAISEKMRGQIRGLNQASRNAQDSISMIQTAEGALNETQAILQRMRELSVQSANDTNVGIDREAIQNEVNQLKSEINRISDTTEFNTKKLLNGTAGVQGVSTASGNADFVSGTENTVEGTYTITVDTAATQESYTTSAGQVNWSAAQNLTGRSLQVNGENVDLSGVADITAVTSAEVLTAINQISGVTASLSGNDLVVTSNEYGSGTLSVTGDVAQFFGTTSAETAGVDAVVSVTGGPQSITGTGRTVEFTSGDVNGMVINAAGAAASTADITVTSGALTLQIGSNEGQTMKVTFNDMGSDKLGTVGGTQVSSIDVSTQSGAESAITVVNDAITAVSAERAKLGAFQNRLEHTIKNLDTSSENLQASESRIRDVDMAKEMMEFTKNNILQQAAQAMLAQANQQPQGVLQLLR